MIGHHALQLCALRSHLLLEVLDHGGLALDAVVGRGVGMFLGSWASGRIVDAFSQGSAAHDWQRIWMVPAAGAAAVLILFAFFFRGADSQTETIAAAPATVER